MKHHIVIRDQNTKIIAKNEFFYLIKNGEKRVVAYKHIKAIFININLKTNINTCYKIAKNIPLYLIDSNGYIIAKLETEVKDETL